MQPLAMAVALTVGWTLFAFSLRRRLRLLSEGASDGDFRLVPLGVRWRRVWEQAFLQRKLRNYPLAGVAHQIIFCGFLVLLVRTLVLWGRGFDPDFDLWVFGRKPLLDWLPLGALYAFTKDLVLLMVLAAVGVFFYLRVLRRTARMSGGVEGLLILAIIAVMMLADLLYDGAQLAQAGVATWRPFPDLAGSLVSTCLVGFDAATLALCEQVGFWTHALLVLVFLNLLPYSKHFHIITAIPNLFFSAPAPTGPLRPLATTSEALIEQLDVAAQLDDPNAVALGCGRSSHLSWKDRLELFSCTECGRCTERCPAALTGKKLSPKQLIVDLRDHLYQSGAEDTDLVPQVIDPDVIWACTTCGACEEECPVAIAHVNKIVQLRRPLLLVRGESFPAELAKPLEALEVNGNPFGLSVQDRLDWAAGLDVPTFAERPAAAVLYWVGCAATYDARARRTARDFVRLLRAADVDFAVLGREEKCTGDVARRAGNEALFLTLAEENIATIRAYQQRGGARRIVTTCPHCFHSLAHEYAQLGATFTVQPHAQLLLELLDAGRLVPRVPLPERIAYHDPCYLGRHNGEYRSPRAVLERIPEATLHEVPDGSGPRALCCGAGGAQMWIEEQNSDRINVRRTRQLLDVGAGVLASACPFCMTMLTDGLKSLDRDSSVENLDIAELLARACDLPG